MYFYRSSKGRQRCIPLSYMNMVYKCRYSNLEARIQFKVNSNIWNTSCPTQMSQQHNVYSHLDMYTSDVSRFKYRVNQPIMYNTVRHINTYRVYGSIISTNIHKPERCTFFATRASFFQPSYYIILALSNACHLWSIYTTIIAECTFSPIGIFVGLAQQSK